MNVLFLEDTQIWIDVYTKLLKKFFGADIVHRDNGGDAGPFLDDVKYDVIICDHYMPGDTGEKVYSHARYSENSLNKETPFIHHSSMPCPRDYLGSESNKNFITVDKDGDIHQLFHTLTELGFDPIIPLPEDTREIMRGTV